MVSYDIIYHEFLKYFRDGRELMRHHVIIAANFAYGWMPTILKTISTDLDIAAFDLQRARDGELLTLDAVGNLANVINGSIVGASKVLHYAALSTYAIWDSRVARYLGTTVQSREAGVAQFLVYNDTCRKMASMPECKAIRRDVGRIIQSNVTSMRALELVMYCGALENRTYA
jgi:hypothetical protein